MALENIFHVNALCQNCFMDTVTYLNRGSTIEGTRAKCQECGSNGTLLRQSDPSWGERLVLNTGPKSASSGLDDAGVVS